jgi:hypothetical protein
MKRFLVFFLLSISSFAQFEPEEVFENRIIEGGFSYFIPYGQYLTRIKSPYGNENALGFSASYLINPFKRKEELSTVFIGLELGLESQKQSSFKNPPQFDSFYAKYSATSARIKVKYVPILVPKKFLPSLSLGLGPKVFKSAMFELIEQGEVTKLLSDRSTALSYFIEAGVEIQYSKNKKRYVKLCLGFDGSNAVKIWDRNKVGFDSNNFVLNPLIASTPQFFYVKTQILSYR